MLSQEKLKQLKDAGYPFPKVKGKDAEPSSDDLIEACGGWFNNLCRRSENLWLATGMDNTISKNAESRKEAVADLFLALKERKVL